MKTERITERIIQFNHKRELNIDTNDLEAIDDLTIFLKAESDIETATNVLEWQEQNMDYWYERVWSYVTMLLSIVGFVIFLVIYKVTLSKSVWGISCLFLGYFIGNLIMLFEKYKHGLKKRFNFKNHKDVYRLLKFTFKYTIPLEQIIKYKQGHCRDYTRLSAAILLNLYIQPYFVTIPSHVAAAIKVKGIFYIIDQSLPLRQLDRWMGDNEAKECRIYKPSKDTESGKVEIEFIEKYAIDKVCPSVANIEKLEHDINIYFRLSQKYNNISEGVPIHIGNKAAFFYDEVTHLSVMRKAIIEIEKQFCNNISKVSHIGIKQIGENLVAIVYC